MKLSDMEVCRAEEFKQIRAFLFDDDNKRHLRWMQHNYMWVVGGWIGYLQAGEGIEHLTILINTISLMKMLMMTQWQIIHRAGA